MHSHILNLKPTHLPSNIPSPSSAHKRTTHANHHYSSPHAHHHIITTTTTDPILLQDAPTTRDYRLDRVRVFVHEDNKVARAPAQG